MRNLFLLILSGVLLVGSYADAGSQSIDSHAAPAAIAVEQSTFLSDFPAGIITGVQVRPEAQIVQARLNVTLDGAVYYTQDAAIPAHAPGESIFLETRWNGITLTRDPSPPWVPLQLWWSLTDSNGNTVQTTPQQQIYQDGVRRPWVASQGVHLSVYTYHQGGDFMAQAVALGDEALVRLQAAFGFALPYRPAIVFYNSAADGDDDLGTVSGVPFGSFVVGRAYPGTSGVVMLARADRAYVQRTLTHELAHLFQYQLGPRVFDAPHWWIEGDAKAHESTASVQQSLSHARGVALAGGLPDLVSWDTRNPATEADLNNVLYLGASFVHYLEQAYGPQSHATFYGNWRSSGDFYASFNATFGKPLPELDQEWRAWLLGNQSVVASAPQAASAEAIPPVLLAELPEGMARVNAYWLNMRTGPSLEHDVLHLLSIGQLFLPLGRDESGEWLLIELPDGTQGWLFAEYIDYDASIEDLTESLYYDDRAHSRNSEQVVERDVERENQ
jgi:hypothetical protein